MGAHMTTPAEFSLRACAAFGVRIKLDGDDLVYEADYTSVPRALLDKLARDKAEIIEIGKRHWRGLGSKAALDVTVTGDDSEVHQDRARQ